MAQGLDLKNWDEQKSASPETKMRLSAILKRTRSSTGSRRIFPPQFKLQVLDSYRNDLDCRGNQRATARKYNIHRRQIQKWLQCEQNLRSSVEEGDGSKKSDSKWTEASALGKTSKIVKSGDGKVDATLNRSAMIYARLSDAEKDENAVGATLNLETEVYDRRDSSCAWNLKRVAQKLYPSSHEKEINVVVGWNPRRVDGSDSKFYTCDSSGRDGNFNRVSPDQSREMSGGELPSENVNRPKPMKILPKECRNANDKPNEIFTVQTGSTSAGSRFEKLRDELNTGGTCQNPFRDRFDEQNLWDEDVRKCVVQKYSVDGQKFYGEQFTRGESTESSCLLNARTPVDANSGQCYSTTGDDKNEKYEDEEDGTKQKTDSKVVTALKHSDESKLFSPKRKWMQESLQEKTYQTLPIKQRVKMDLKSAAASASAQSSTSSAKGVSPNFTIEKLCASDIKTENVTPPSFHSPSDSEYFNWRPSGTCLYPGYPLVSHSSAALPFPPPPLLFSHRVIPDLVSLHFKPESSERKISQQYDLGRSCSPESLDMDLKEEKVSDGEENGDIDVLSTTPVEKKSFEFTGYNFGKRRSFSVQFKLTVLDAFYNDKDCNKNQRATARKFNINRRQVQKWLSQENDLRSEGSVKSGKYLQRQRLGSEREVEVEETCKQCPQHCNPKKKEAEEMDKTIEVNVKHCTDKECLSRDKSSPDSSSTPFGEGFEFYSKGYYQSDLKSGNVYENYLFPENSSLISHDSFFSWPNINMSALPVPNFHFMASWYHNFDYCQEKSKIC